MDAVDPRVIEIALSRAGGANFENFAQGFFAAMLGADYVPLGGTHDDGADGALAGAIFEVATTDRFMQASAFLRSPSGRQFHVCESAG